MTRGVTSQRAKKLALGFRECEPSKKSFSTLNIQQETTMSSPNKIINFLTPFAVELVFKSMKPKLLAQAAWEFDPERDQIGYLGEGAQSIPKHGVIRLLRPTTRVGGWFGTAPIIMAYFDGKRRYPLHMKDIHWQIPDFQPYKSEFDAWKTAQVEAANIRKENEEQQVRATHANIKAQDGVQRAKQTTTITITTQP
jgi:hypothetical protein